jgi:putative FmdB family regulatory protein
MPIYEYKCSQCGHVFDAFQRVGADGTDLVCPECGAHNPQKMVSCCSSIGIGGSFDTGGGSAGCGRSGFG